MPVVPPPQGCRHSQGCEGSLQVPPVTASPTVSPLCHHLSTAPTAPSALLEPQHKHLRAAKNKQRKNQLWKLSTSPSAAQGTDTNSSCRSTREMLGPSDPAPAERRVHRLWGCPEDCSDHRSVHRPWECPGNCRTVCRDHRRAHRGCGCPQALGSHTCPPQWENRQDAATPLKHQTNQTKVHQIFPLGPHGELGCAQHD